MNKQKEIPTLFSVLILLVVASGVFYFIKDQAKFDNSDEFIRPDNGLSKFELEEVQENSRKIDDSEKEVKFDEITSIEKAKEEFSKHINSETNYSYDSFLDGYSFYIFNGKGLISARKSREENPDSRLPYDLYFYSNGNYEKIIDSYFGGLMEGVPKIESYKENLNLTHITTGYGDICGYYSDTIYIDLQNPYERSISQRRNNCEFDETLKLINPAGIEYVIKPIYDKICDIDVVGREIELLSIKAVSNDEEYEMSFSEKIKGECSVVNSSVGTDYGAFNISFKEIKQNINGNFEGFVQIYSLDEKINKDIPFEFSFLEGFID